MKKAVSFLLSIVMTVSIVGGLDFSVLASQFEESNIVDNDDLYIYQNKADNFNYLQYVAQHYTSDEIKSIIEFRINQTTNSQNLVYYLNGNVPFQASYAVWESATFITNPVEGISDQLNREAYYETILLRAINSSVTSDNAIDWLNQGAIKNSIEILNNMTKAAETDYYAFMTQRNISISNLTQSEYEALTEFSNNYVKSKAYKIFGSDLSFISDIISLSSDIEEYSEKLASYCQLMELGEAMADFLTRIKANTDDKYLKSAIDSVIPIIRDSYSQALSTSIYDGLLLISSTAIKKVVGDVWKKALANMLNNGVLLNGTTIVNAAFLAIGFTKTIGNIAFSTDAKLDKYELMKAFCSFNDSLEKTIALLINNYEVSDNYSNLLLDGIEILYSTYIIDTELCTELVNICKKDWINYISDEDYDNVIATYENNKTVYENEYDFITIKSGNCSNTVSWIILNNEDLLIYGFGDIPDYKIGETPWYQEKNNIKGIYVSSNITYIGSYSFYGLENVQNEIDLTKVKYCKNACFDGIGCNAIIYLDNSVTFYDSHNISCIMYFKNYSETDTLVLKTSFTLSPNCQIFVDGNLEIRGYKFLTLEKNANLDINGNLNGVDVYMDEHPRIYNNSGVITVRNNVTGLISYTGDCNDAFIVFGDYDCEYVFALYAGSGWMGSWFMSSNLYVYGNIRNYRSRIKGTFSSQVCYDSKVYLLGEKTHKIESSDFATLIVKEGDISFTTAISVYVLLNHNGHQISLYNNGINSSFPDYDGDGYKDNVDPYPLEKHPTEHSYVFSGTVDPTCIEEGYDAYICEYCNGLIKENLIDKIPHDYSYSSTVTPSCTAQGYDIYKCSQCSETEKRNYTSALGHDYEYQSTIVPTCTEKGYDTYKCSRCSTTEKRNYVNSVDHSYEYIKTIEPTCAISGYDLYKCANCGKEEQRNQVNTLPHNYVYQNTTTPTCIDQGYDTYKCVNCGSLENRNYVNAIGHNNVLTDTVLSTCNTAGYYEYTCSVCGNVSQEVIAKLDGSVLTGVLEDVQEKLNNNTFSEEGYTNLKAVYDKHKNGLYTYTSQIEVDHAVTEINTAINMAVSETVLGDTAGGTTEDGLSWSWSRETGVLTVTGEGVMDGYDSATMPWYEVLPYTTSIIIGEGITSIGRYAFYNAVNVTNISLPSTLTNLDERAFEYCTSVEELVVPDSVTSIGYGAFGNLTGLKKVSVPASATYRSYGFYNANAVEEIIITPGTDGVIPDSNVTAEQGWLWDWMMKSTGNFGPWKYADNAVVTISEGVTSIGAKTFYNCAGISEISIPESVISISSEAFYNCDMLRNIELGKNVESIGVSSFAECDNLQKITVLNPNCTFSDSSIVGNMDIEGYRNSTAQAYAEANSINFIPIEAPDTLKISTVSLSLESSITMNFKVLKTDLADFEDPYVVFTCEGDELTVTEYKEQGEYYVFSYPGISPQLMNDEVNAVLYATYSNDGEVYNSPAKVMSVREYAYTLLERYSSADYAQLRTLLVDLLNYGAAAQIYVGYQTDELVNSDLTEEQRSWGTNDEPEFENIRDYHYMTVDSPESEWLGSGLVLNNSVTIRAKFSADDIENKTVVITCGNGEFTYSKDDFVKAEDGNYYVYCDELFANEMSKEILLTVYDNGIQCSDTMRFSIESYAKLVHDSYTGTALDDLTTAMMRYGRSAEAYGL